MNKNIIFTKAKCNILLIIDNGILLILIFGVIGLSIRLFKLDYSNLSYVQITVSIFFLLILCLFVFVIIIIANNLFSLKSLKQIKLTLHEHCIELERNSESCKIVCNGSSHVFFYFGGWIFIWSSENNYHGFYLTKDWIGRKNLTDWTSYLKENFQSYTMPEKDKKEILRKFHINILNYHKLVVWPPRILCKQA